MSGSKILRSFSSGVSRVKEMRTRSYLDKWLGSDISGAPSPSVLAPKAQSVKSNDKHLYEPRRTHRSGPPLNSVSAPNHVESGMNLPVLSSSWVVANNHVASALFVEEIEQQLSGVDTAYMLDMANITIESPADALKLVSVLAENENISNSLLGFTNCSELTISLLAGINCALPCLVADKSIGSRSKSFLLSSLAPTPAAAEPTLSRTHSEPSAPTVTAPSTFTYFGAVRSGQQIYSPGSASIIILGNINNGGEVLSDGDIHIYGKLLGRVICGLKGDSSCKIYCRSFEPALVGISDSFIMVEDYMNELAAVTGKPVCVSYHSAVEGGNGSTAALRRTANDSSVTSQVLEPTVRIPMGDAGGYVAFTILPS